MINFSDGGVIHTVEEITDENGEEFTKSVKAITGIDVDVVSGETEAKLALLGALNGCDGGVIDIGGASTEVAVKEDGEVVYSTSYKVGAVALKNQFVGDKDKITNHLKSVLFAPKRLYKSKFYAIGGTVTTIASIDLKQCVYNPDLIHGHTLSIDRVKEIADELFSISPQEIIEKYPTATPRVDVISGGAQILYEVMLCYGIDVVTVSESDNLEGYLEYLLNEKTKN